MTDRKKILIIDDEESTVRALVDHFRFDGYDVFSACDGEDGLKKIAKVKPDLILLDIIMPKLDGISMLKKLKEETNEARETPTVMLTNLRTAETVSEALKTGVFDYLVKVDYSLKDLSKKVAEVLNRKNKE